MSEKKKEATYVSKLQERALSTTHHSYTLKKVEGESGNQGKGTEPNKTGDGKGELGTQGQKSEES